MFKKQVTALTAILKDKDIREYSGDAFWNIIKAVVLGDVGALLDVTNDLKDILFHTPTVLFWDKMQRYLFAEGWNLLHEPSGSSYHLQI